METPRSTNGSQRILQSKALQFVNSHYQLDRNNYLPKYRLFVDRVNSNLLNPINNANISIDDFENTLEEFRKHPKLVYYMSILQDTHGDLLEDIVSNSMGFVKNTLKRNKLKILVDFLTYEPGLSDIEEPIGSDTD